MSGNDNTPTLSSASGRRGSAGHAPIGRPAVGDNSAVEAASSLPPSDDATEKICTQCGVKQALQLFKRDRRKLSGYSSWCLVCQRAETKAHPERHRRYCQRNRAAIRKRGQAEYRRRRSHRLAYDRAQQGGLRRRAHNQLNNALKRGGVVKPTRCESCLQVTPKLRLHGHHKDYRKPLDVCWLCSECHGREHWK